MKNTKDFTDFGLFVQVNLFYFTFLLAFANIVQ